VQIKLQFFVLTNR